MRVLIGGIFGLLFISAAPPPNCDAGYNSRFGVKHREHRGVGYEEGYTTLSAFLCPKWERFVPFLDARAHIFNDNRLASNVGVGARFPTFANTWVFGGNAYWDYRDSRHLNTHQVGGGVEALNKYVDIRANIYVPFHNDRHASRYKLSKCEGASVLIKQSMSLALPSVDSEVGVPLFWNWSKVVDLYFAVGPYYLFQETGKKSSKKQAALGVIPPKKAPKVGDTLGVRGRMTAKVYDGIELGLIGTYDKTFNGTIQGYIAFTFPLGPANMRSKGSLWQKRYLSPQCNDTACLRRLLSKDVERSEIIPVKTTKRSLDSVKDCEQIIELIQALRLDIPDHIEFPEPSSSTEEKTTPSIPDGFFTWLAGQLAG